MPCLNKIILGTLSPPSCVTSFMLVTLKWTVWFLGLDEVLGKRTNEWVANPLGPGQTSALQIKTRSA